MKKVPRDDVRCQLSRIYAISEHDTHKKHSILQTCYIHIRLIFIESYMCFYLVQTGSRVHLHPYPFLLNVHVTTNIIPVSKTKTVRKIV